MNILRYDSPFMKKLNMIVDYFLLGILWLVASIPVITFGAATTAAFFTAEKSIHKDNGKVFSTFWTSFCKEFKQATVLWVIELVLIAVWVLNAFLLRDVEVNDIIYVLLLLALLVEFGWMQLWFAYLSKFNDNTKVLLGNTLRIAVGKFPLVLLLTVVRLIAITGFVVALIHLTPIPLFIPGAYLLVAGSVLRKIFKAYLPLDTTEDTKT